jgi:hypothetical protein
MNYNIEINLSGCCLISFIILFTVMGGLIYLALK